MYTQKICRESNIVPARSRGQNFLISQDIYDYMVESADLSSDDTVLEVGPGLGFLTQRLALKAKKVIAVELDDNLTGILRKRLDKQGIRNVDIINKDILKFGIHDLERSTDVKGAKSPIGDLAPGDLIPRDAEYDYKIVSNLPYNITSIFLRRFLSEVDKKPNIMVLMLQKEVAERVCAVPGRMSLLSVSVRFYAEAQILRKVGKENFWPRPQVDSAIIKLKVFDSPTSFSNGLGPKDFFRFIKFGFSAKRKMLKNNLSAGLHISQQEAEKKLKEGRFDPGVRAQELSVADWIKLFGIFFEKMV